MNKKLLFIALLAGCLVGAAPGSPPSSAKPTSAAPPAKRPQPQKPDRKFDLRFRPEAGRRIAYEQALESDLRADAASVANVRVTKTQKLRRRISVLDEQVTELGEEGDTVVAKRVTFGPDSWYSRQEDDQPERKTRLVFAGKTVNYRVTPDGKVEQDYGVKPGPEVTRMLRNSILGRHDLFAGHPVSVGDRWRADDSLRALCDLRPSDTVSAILSFKNVRTENGREVADLHLSAGVITREMGFLVEISIEGPLAVDVATGVMLMADLKGTSTLSGGMGGDYGKRRAVSVVGGGTMRLAERARILPPGAPAATRPSSRPAAAAPPIAGATVN